MHDLRHFVHRRLGKSVLSCLPRSNGRKQCVVRKTDTHLHQPPSYAFWVGPLCILLSTNPHPPILEQQRGWRSEDTTQLGLLRNGFKYKCRRSSDDVWLFFIAEYNTTEVTSWLTMCPCSIPPPVTQNEQPCRADLVCLTTLWNSEGFKCGSSGIRGLSVDGGRVIIPENVQFSWVSISQHTGYHHPVKKDKWRLYQSNTEIWAAFVFRK